LKKTFSFVWYSSTRSFILTFTCVYVDMGTGLNLFWRGRGREHLVGPIIWHILEQPVFYMSLSPVEKADTWKIEGTSEAHWVWGVCQRVRLWGGPFTSVDSSYLNRNAHGTWKTLVQMNVGALNIPGCGDLEE
jgi:hypothetical protein